MKLRPLLLPITIAISFCFLPPAARADVLKIVVDDTIQPMAVEFIDHGMQEAKRSHSEAILIELNTPGGLMVSMHEIVEKILDSPVPVIVYVTPAGAHAASAGFFILESADVAAMAPATHTGAAHPVLINPLTDKSIPLDPVMKEKVENDALAMLRSYIGKRGRNQQVAESTIKDSKALTADEALAQHLIDYVASDENDLLRQMDGKTIARFDGSKTTLHVAGKTVRLYEMSLREQTLSLLMNPTLAALLLTFGLAALYIEFNHPGAIVPGVLGFIAVLLAVFALHFLPVRYEALVLIVGAFVLYALEAKMHSHGILTAGGIFIMVLGMLLLVDGPIPEMRVKLWAALSISIPFGLITVFLMSLAMHARRNKVVMGEKGIIGETGTVTASLNPSGTVLLRGALWNATATVNVPVGQQVVVRGIHNLMLEVEPVSQPATLNPAQA
ncbi:MAG TPA: nodulation protein NfeD [Candidatus Angelobacter sp.]|nr:nodulation protein NfeD [Candidatus Angelobacter sp.]